MGDLALAFQDDRALFTPGATRDSLLQQMRRMGGKYVRANVEYSKTQGGKDLSNLDGLIDAARSHGLKVQATLMSDPSYAAEQGALNHTTNDPKVWAEFARTVAQHEKGRVSRYSVGNEMNYKAFHKDGNDNPRAAGRAYRQEYRAGYNALKAVDPTNEVLLGELTSGGGDPRQFMKGLLGGKPIKTTGLAYHPYNNKGGNAWDINSLPSLQATLGRYKRSGQLQTAQGKQAGLYLTEYGNQRSDYPNDQTRARLSADAYRKAQKAGAKEFVQYQLTEKTGTPGTPADEYGNGGTPGALKHWWDTSVGTEGGDLSTFARALRTVQSTKKRVR